jgi:putative addiction module antidote
MLKLKVKQIGNSAGVVLPKEALNHLNVAKGDDIYLVEAEDGYSISAYDPKFGEQMAAMDVVGRQYRNTLKELAK